MKSTKGLNGNLWRVLICSVNRERKIFAVDAELLKPAKRQKTAVNNCRRICWMAFKVDKNKVLLMGESMVSNSLVKWGFLS